MSPSWHDRLNTRTRDPVNALAVEAGLLNLANAFDEVGMSSRAGERHNRISPGLHDQRNWPVRVRGEVVREADSKQQRPTLADEVVVVCEDANQPEL